MRHRVIRNGIVKWIGEYDREEFASRYYNKIEEDKERRKIDRARKRITYNEEKVANAFLHTVIEDLKNSDLKVISTVDLTDKYGKNKRTSFNIFFNLLKELGCLIPRPEGGHLRANHFDVVKIQELIANETLTYARCAQLRKETNADQAKRRKERDANSK